MGCIGLILFTIRTIIYSRCNRLLIAVIVVKNVLLTNRLYYILLLGNTLLLTRGLFNPIPPAYIVYPRTNSIV